MLKFGTSGVRGLASELTDKECYLYTKAFLKYLKNKDLIKKNSTVAIAGDFRPSTLKILKAVSAAVRDNGFRVDYCGIIPTPVVSLYGFKRKIPSIMVTGSHIPYDRNGIKFNLPDGETLKKDERAISAIYEKSRVDKPAVKIVPLPETNKTAEREFIQRYLKFFSARCLQGKTIVVYQQSSVMRDIIAEILKKLGARVVAVGRSEKFIPIDTEAIGQAELKKARVWTKKYRPDAIVSADGDGDRPVLFDENGNFIRGDFLDIICAAYLKADSVSATASCNTALEKCGRFKNVNRTKIGSPYAAEAMQKDKKKGFKRIVSYEANGGILLGSDIKLNGRLLSALPTRDSIIPLLSALMFAREYNLTLSKSLSLFPQRLVYSQSIKGVPTEISKKILKRIHGNTATAKKQAKILFGLPLAVKKVNLLDGVRLYLANDDIVHIRPSANSPEIRVYSEADSLNKAKYLTERTLKKIAQLVK